MSTEERTAVQEADDLEYLDGRGPRREHERLWTSPGIYRPENDRHRPTASRQDQYGRLAGTWSPNRKRR